MKPKQFDNPGCCPQGSIYIEWLKPSRKKSSLDFKAGPERAGWSMSVDDVHVVNINFCPFCGTKVEDMQPVKGAHNVGAVGPEGP